MLRTSRSPHPSPDDPELADLAALRHATSALVGRIYERHAEDLARVMGRILLEREATLDCLHDLFADLPRRLASFDGRATLGTWLHTVAVRLALDELRRRRRRARMRTWLGSLVHDAQEVPELALMRDEESHLVKQALAQEPALDRAVLVLTSVEGKSYAEAAEMLGITIESLRARHKRVRSRLARRLGKEPPS